MGKVDMSLEAVMLRVQARAGIPPRRKMTDDEVVALACSCGYEITPLGERGWRSGLLRLQGPGCPQAGVTIGIKTLRGWVGTPLQETEADDVATLIRTTRGLLDLRERVLDYENARLMCRDDAKARAAMFAAVPGIVPDELFATREIRPSEPATPLDRDALGRVVRKAWVEWAMQHPHPKTSWLVPYDDLDEPDREADRQIGEAVARAVVGRRTVEPATSVVDALRRENAELERLLRETQAREAKLDHIVIKVQRFAGEIGILASQVFPEQDESEENE